MLYIEKSKVHGKGLYSSKNLYKNDCIGLLSVYNGFQYIDTPKGKFINHSSNSYNIDLKVKKYYYENVIYVYGFANRFIPANTELYANYLDKNAPTPNFLKFN